MAGQATLTDKITGAEDGDDGLPAGIVDDGEFDGALLDVENRVGMIALGKDDLPLPIFDELTRRTGGLKERVGVEIVLPG